MKMDSRLKVGDLLLVAVLTLAVVPFAGPGWCGEDKGPSGSAEKQGEGQAERDLQAKEQKPSRVRLPKFVPPKRGAPVGRIAGGARGAVDGLPTLVALVPEHVALTSTASPTLYWYTSEVPAWPVELTVAEPRAESPLLVRNLTPPMAAGIQRVDLDALGGRLEPAHDYLWYVALVRDDQSRSRDLLAWGGVRWEGPSDELRTAVTKANLSDLPARYAAAGYWYEALDAAVRLSESGPDQAGGEAARDSLLAQVGLGWILSGGAAQ